MDSSVSPKEEIWFPRVCHHISTDLYKVKRGKRGQKRVLSLMFSQKIMYNNIHIRFKSTTDASNKARDETWLDQSNKSLRAENVVILIQNGPIQSSLV